jgi:hypothetical protein
LLALAIPAAAKGPVDMITIVGPGIDEPIEITDMKILWRFDPWAAQFMDAGGPLEAPPDVGSAEPYQVVFYLRDNSDELQMRYVFDYYPAVTEDRSYIYFPGPGEPSYEVNIGTIIRDNSDGRWHYAMPTWGVMVQEQLQAHSVTRDNARQITPPIIFWIAAVSFIVIVGSMIWWVVRGKAQRPNRPIYQGFD